MVFGDISAGTITAGEDVRLTAYGSVGAEVTANRNASVYAFDSISGNVNATEGNATVSTFGDLCNAVDAGNDAFVVAGTSCDVIVDANRHCPATITFPPERQLEFPVSGAGGESPSDN